MQNQQQMHELTQLVEAYHTVMEELRHIMALHQRMAMIMSSAKQDMHKLEAAVHRAQDLERDVAASAPPGGAA